MTLMLLLALKEQGNDKAYPDHFVEHTLLAFFIKKANTRNDLLSLFKGMSEAMSPKTILRNAEVLKNDSKQKEFLTLEFRSGNYDVNEIKKDPSLAAKQFANNFLSLISFAIQDNQVARALPQVLSYGTAKHSSLGSSTYSDCGETALRNFFNFIIYDQKNGKYNSQFLNQIKGSKIKPALINFYDKNNDPLEARQQSVRDEWSQEVVSGHSGVIYSKEMTCDIDVGIDNMMVLLDRLLFGEEGRISKAQPRSAKLDELCTAVSRDGFELSWNRKNRDHIDSNNVDVEIEFRINNIPKFQWKFLNNHFVIADITSTERQSWKKTVGDEFLKLFDQAHDLSDKQQLQSLLPWFAPADILTKNRSSHLSDNFIYAFPVASNNEKIAALQKVEFLRGPHGFSFANKLIKKLPNNDDEYTQKTIAEVLINSGYPVNQIVKVIKENHLRKAQAICIAAKFGNTILMEQLIQENAPLPDCDGIPLLIVAVAENANHWNVVKLLIEKYKETIIVQKDRDGNNIVKLAAKAKQWEIVKYCIENFYDTIIERSNAAEKESLFSLAKTAKDKDILNLITKKQRTSVAFLKQLNFSTRENFAHRVVRNFLKWEDFSSLAVKANLDIWKQQDEKGYTPIHAAANNGNIRIIELFLNEPDIMNQQNKLGNVAHVAVLFSQWDIMTLIADKFPEAMKAKNNDGNTPVHLAIKRYNWDKVNIIAQKTPEAMTVMNNDGDSSLYLAAKSGKLDVISTFLNHFINTPTHVDEILKIRVKDDQTLGDLMKENKEIESIINSFRKRKEEEEHLSRDIKERNPVNYFNKNDLRGNKRTGENPE